MNLRTCSIDLASQLSPEEHTRLFGARRRARIEILEDLVEQLRASDSVDPLVRAEAREVAEDLDAQATRLRAAPVPSREVR